MAAVTVLTTTVPGCPRIRPDPAHPGRRGHRDRRGGRRHPQQRAIREINAGIYAFDIRRAAVGTEPAVVRQRPARALPPTPLRSLRPTDNSCTPAHRRRRPSPGERPRCNWRHGRGVEPPDRGGPPTGQGHRGGSPAPGSTSRWRSAATPIARERSCWAPPGSAAAAIGPDTTLADVRVGDGARVVRVRTAAR